jgi:hypothetical protein
VCSSFSSQAPVTSGGSDGAAEGEKKKKKKSQSVQARMRKKQQQTAQQQPSPSTRAAAAPTGTTVHPYDDILVRATLFDNDLLRLFTQPRPVLTSVLVDADTGVPLYAGDTSRAADGGVGFGFSGPVHGRRGRSGDPTMSLVSRPPQHGRYVSRIGGGAELGSSSRDFPTPLPQDAASKRATLAAAAESRAAEKRATQSMQ